MVSAILLSFFSAIHVVLLLSVAPSQRAVPKRWHFTDLVEMVVIRIDFYAAGSHSILFVYKANARTQYQISLQNPSFAINLYYAYMETGDRFSIVAIMRCPYYKVRELKDLISVKYIGADSCHIYEAVKHISGRVA